MHVLIVEDEPMVARWMTRVLTEDGYVVQTAVNGDEGLLLGAAGGFDIALVDMRLPARNGIAVVRGIRQAGQTMPIIIVAGESSDEDVVRGLDAGADDYLMKPVSNEILKARVRAALRRGGSVRNEQLAVGPLRLDRQRRQVTCGGAPLDLTAQELMLVEHFMLHAGEVVARADLLARVWGMRFDPESNMIDAAMNRLRAKLSAVESAPSITTVRGVGFMLVAEPPPA